MSDVRGGVGPEGHESEEDRRLAALLRSTQARPNPAVWLRVRAELDGATRPAGAGALDRLVAWCSRPAALAVALGAGWGVLATIPAPGDEGAAIATGGTTTFIETLLDDSAAIAADEGDEAAPLEAPTDSGGRS